MEESQQAFIVFAKGIRDFNAHLLVTDFPILVVDSEEQASGVIRALKSTAYADLEFSLQPFLAAAQFERAAHEVLIDKALDGQRGEIARELCITANEIFRRSGGRGPTGKTNEGEEEPLTKAKRKGKERGRPCDTDPKDDKRIAEAWGTRQYLTYADLGKAKGKSRLEVKRAIDRNRKRKSNGKKRKPK